MPIWHKIDLQHNLKQNRKGAFYIKQSIQQENITIGNMYAPKSRAPKHIKQILTYLKGETDNITMIIGDFSTPLSTMDKSSRQK